MKITVYSTQSCPWCVRLKEFLKDKNIEFEDVDVAADRDKAMEMVEKSGQMGVPVTIITEDIKEGSNEKPKEHILVGFDEVKLKELLKIE